MPSSSTCIKIVAEYAKSGRSSCKKCSEKIDSKSLRLGSSIWDPRGYENTKSYHSDCFFPLDVNLLSAELIEGFSQLKSNDQEKLKKLMTERDQSSKKTSDKIDEDIGLKIDFSANDVKDNYKDAMLLQKSYIMSNIAKLEFAALEVSGKNYVSWMIDVKMHLESVGISNTIYEFNN
ncbi:polynucleotide 3'-phosphatase ZDP-like [Lactuca sativa]|uniref:polynucleotide 3'-phosphatase ZDP-like n=1 Tax=Lactuca sativa TaxID=4236 RepID=UPI0022AFD1F0|nr:polynucleotide 3'-phosphatase ZDP-like [Lactuca sativa]